jgi:hypothetical protein
LCRGGRRRTTRRTRGGGRRRRRRRRRRGGVGFAAGLAGLKRVYIVGMRVWVRLLGGCRQAGNEECLELSVRNCDDEVGAEEVWQAW